MRRGTRLHRRCQSLLDTLGIPQNVDLEGMRAWAAAVRGRPVHLRAMPDTPASPTGLWIATDVEDLVLVKAHTSALHARHIAFHEIGHMLWQHENTDHTLGAGPLPHLDRPVVRRILARRESSNPREQEAEMLATMLSIRASTPLTRRRGNLAEVVSAARALHRLRPLWRDLRAIEPRAPVLSAGWTTMVTPAGWQFRLLRRVIEIRDAQVTLRDYTDLFTVPGVVPVQGDPTGLPPGPDPTGEARWLASACRARLAGAPPAAAGAALRIGGGTGLGEEVAALLALAAAWPTMSTRGDRRGVVGSARARVQR